MKSSLNRYFSKIIRLSRIHAHDIWIGSIFLNLILFYPQWSLAFHPALYIMNLGKNKYFPTENI